MYRGPGALPSFSPPLSPLSCYEAPSVPSGTTNPLVYQATERGRDRGGGGGRLPPFLTRAHKFQASFGPFSRHSQKILQSGVRQNTSLSLSYWKNVVRCFSKQCDVKHVFATACTHITARTRRPWRVKIWFSPDMAWKFAQVGSKGREEKRRVDPPPPPQVSLSTARATFRNFKMRLSLLHCPSPSVQILAFSSLYHQFAQNRHRPPPPFTFYLAKRKKDSRMHAEASAVWAKSDTAEVRGNKDLRLDETHLCRRVWILECTVSVVNLIATSVTPSL